MIPGTGLARTLAICATRGPFGSIIAGGLERVRAWPRDRLVVLTYHRVAPPGVRPDLHPGLVSADPEAFHEQVTWVARRATVVDLATVLRAADGEPLPPRSVLITFDDAYADVAEHAWPVLRELGLPAVMFVPTGAPDGGGAFWWDRLHAAIELGSRPRRLRTPAGELGLDTPAGRATAFAAIREHVKTLPHEEAMATVDALVVDLRGPAVPPAALDWPALRRLAAQGLTLAPHSRTHPVLPTVDDERLRVELLAPLDDLRREVGEAPPVLAYPSGIHDGRVRAAAADAGYRLAFTTRRGAIASLRAADPMALPRVNVGGRTTLALLRMQLAPAWDRLAGRAAT